MEHGHTGTAHFCPAADPLPLIGSASRRSICVALSSPFSSEVITSDSPVPSVTSGPTPPVRAGIVWVIPWPSPTGAGGNPPASRSRATNLCGTRVGSGIRRLKRVLRPCSEASRAMGSPSSASLTNLLASCRWAVLKSARPRAPSDVMTTEVAAPVAFRLLATPPPRAFPRASLRPAFSGPSPALAACRSSG
jgi:hypothetical protein